MADSSSLVQQINAGAGADTKVNENFDAASPAMMYGRRASATAGLSWGFYGGRYAGVLVANGAVTLAASSTNYVVASRSTGDVSVSTSSANWGDSAGYLRLYKIVAGTATVTSYEDHRESGAAAVPRAQALELVCGDDATVITTGAGKATLFMPFAFKLAEVVCGLATQQSTGSTFTVNVKAAGATIFSTKPTVDNAEDTSVTAATPAVLSTTTLAKGAKITVDVDQVGDGTAKGLKVYLVGVPG